ncbi:hypothetical protein [Streptomyces sp. VRA16 Mangrove soil]|uniref:hypothetical protein n=1 Tax=Streptomyces sp. VRA16 Mangrove soil TaxID=2817434 RepID=UPI001A9E88ED|nr:hypothetical protein [Streptomyces sp. VRA16 Mangrove soil]MBO1330812.1 hypothetical protein [Streptomyces sp. VRA16 Mangrove soil]
MSALRKSAATRLLDRLDPLPHPRRQRETARSARELAGRGELAAVIAELDAQGPYERGVCTLLACAGGATEWVAEHLADPDPFVRGHVLRAAKGLDVPDAAFEAALDDAPEAVRRPLLRAIVEQRRTALADRLVDALRAEWGDTEGARLLPGCSAATVARVLPDVFHAVRGWNGLVARHPDIVLDCARAHLAEVPENARDGWWQQYGHILAALAATAPQRVLDLLEAHPPRHFPWSLRTALGTLTTAAPGRVLRMMTGRWRDRLHGRGTLTPAVLRAVVRSGAPELDAYLPVAAGHPEDLAALLRAQAPAGRPAVHETALAGRGAAHRDLDTGVLDALPRFYVAEVARRAARTARERGDSWDTVLLAESYLPPAEAREALDAATRRPVAAHRAVAWPLYVRNAARSADPAQVTATAVELAARLRNEQDPVRSAALQALADDVRPALWRSDALAHLGRLATDALQARDCSYGTRGALTALAVGILGHHAADGEQALVDWALDTVVAVHGHTGAVRLGRLDHTLRRGQEHAVYEALLPRIEAEEKKNDFRLLLTLTGAVGRRAAHMAGLQERLGRAVAHGSDSTVREAVPLWLEPRATRDERVARLLDQEPSAVELWGVAEVVTRRRTDLLDRFLTGRPPYGRFLMKNSAWALRAAGSDTRRWPPRQQRAYLAQLKGIADDTGLDLWRRAEAVRRAVHVPEGGAGLARRTAADPDADVTLVEAALAALGRTPDDLPLLLSHAGDDRARVAVYAVTQASRHARPSRLAPLLDELLTGPGKKVTSRKEAARLIALRLPAAQAAPLLARGYAGEGAHRDVRAAIVAFAAYQLLGEDAAWEILTDAVGEDSEAVLRQAALRLSVYDVAPPLRARYAALIASVADTAPADNAELADTALTALASWVPWAPQALETLARLLTDVERRAPKVWGAAGKALVSVAGQTAAAAATLTGAVRTLMAHGPAPDAGEEQDRPAHRRIEYVAGILAEEARKTPALRPLARELGRVLAEDDAFVPRAAQVGLAALDFAALTDGLRDLARLHDGRPALAARTAQELRGRLRGGRVRGEVLLPAARELAAAGSATEGLFAWALVAAGGARVDWPEPWRAELRALRSHPCADVRDAAAELTTAP